MDEGLEDLPVEIGKPRVTSELRDPEPAPDHLQMDVVDEMNRMPPAEETGQVDQVAVDRFLDEERSAQAARLQRLRVGPRAARENPLTAPGLIDLDHDRIPDILAGGDDSPGRFDDREPWSRHAAGGQCPGEPNLRSGMSEMLRPGQRNEPALRDAIERGVADLADEIVIAGNDQAPCPCLPGKGPLDPSGGRLEGENPPHHAGVGQTRIAGNGITHQSGPHQEPGHRAHLVAAMADDERGAGGGERSHDVDQPGSRVDGGCGRRAARRRYDTGPSPRRRVMRGVLKVLVVLAILGAAAAAGWEPATAWWAARNRPKFDTLAAERGDVVEVINSTGTLQPVQSVHVGAFVSGPIVGLHADFNEEVKEGDILAEIDPRTYRANVARDKAALAARRAELERGAARLQQARREEDRSNALAERNVASISESDLDQAHFTRVGMEAEIVMAEAAIEQAEANLDTSEANLGYTKILAPVAGIVIDRKVELGQTLAAQFQTPELFVIAPDMRREMRIFASVDEADIGQIREAQESGKSVEFAVDAYPGEVFAGKIAQIRLASTTTQNVVTYPVVLSTPNPDLKLLPGMTAEISFQVDRRDDVLKVPNAALRFYPLRDHVREADRAILDGGALEADDQARGEVPSASAKAAAEGERKRRHVWVVEPDGLLRGIAVTVGIGDHRSTEIVSGDVEPGQRLVVGIAPKDD